MSIVTLKKLTLCGLQSNKEEVLNKLQKLGGVHLISLNKLITSSAVATQKESEKTLFALKYLNQCANKRHQMLDREEFDMDVIVQQVLEVERKTRGFSDQYDFLSNRIEEVKPWGDFNLVAENDLAGIKCWFYIVPKRLLKLLGKDLVYQVVHEDNIHSYVVILAQQEPSSDSVPVPRSHTGKIPLSQLLKDLQSVELALDDMHAERESLTRWVSLMTLNLVENEDNAALTVARSLTLDDQNLFVIQAWIAKDQLDKYEKFAIKNGLALLLEEINKSDYPPTLLKNRELLAGGEELIKFYQTPAYHDWDPSSVVFFSFAFFFAMILSDAGYALVLAVLLALKWSSMDGSIQGKRLRVLAAVTVIFSLIWGVLSGGYFGYTPAPESLAALFKVLDINDFDSMMRLSIAVGVIHIILANLIRAYQIKEKKTALASLGWISLVVGGFLLWLEIDNTEQLAYCLLVLGCGLLLFFSAERILYSPSDFLRQLLDGVINMTGVTKIFGDILSYMRLFALGLASASLALTFNQIAEQVYFSVPGLGLLFSILILLLGHTLNLMLCLMSGLVHGLRLNFIEFYNWSISDEGYPFNVFSKKSG